MLNALQSYKFSARYTNLSLHISSRTKRFAVLHSPYVPKVRTSWHLPEVRTSPCFFLHSPCPPVRGICNQPAESIGICNPGTVIAPRYEYLYIMYSQPSSSGGFEIRPQRVWGFAIPEQLSLHATAQWFQYDRLLSFII